MDKKTILMIMKLFTNCVLNIKIILQKFIVVTVNVNSAEIQYECDLHANALISFDRIKTAKMFEKIII